MSNLVEALRFLRQHAGLNTRDGYWEYEGLDSLTQTNWLNEALTDLQKTGGYVLPAKYTRNNQTLALLVEQGR